MVWEKGEATIPQFLPGHIRSHSVQPWLSFEHVQTRSDDSICSTASFFRKDPGLLKTLKT